MVQNWLKDRETENKDNAVNRHHSHLQTLSEWIVNQHLHGSRASLNFVCTHNSRRSQFAQTWCKVVQDYLAMDLADSYSGGTEVTACNERTIAALKRTGFSVKVEGNENPVYTLTADGITSGVKLWSKLFNDPSGPDENFAAVMTCDHADKNCPFIPGASIRVPLTYTDPKYADNTPEEEKAYDRTCKIIATDMLRLFRLVESKLNKKQGDR
jgi:arsenate reductase (thioredoxin)